MKTYATLELTCPVNFIIREKYSTNHLNIK
jgi:hypothetical protein